MSDSSQARTCSSFMNQDTHFSSIRFAWNRSRLFATAGQASSGTQKFSRENARDFESCPVLFPRAEKGGGVANQVVLVLADLFENVKAVGFHAEFIEGDADFLVQV